MIREMELLFQASRTSPMLHEAAVTVEAGVAALRNERDELVLQNERLGNDFVAVEARCARLQQALAWYDDHKREDGFYDWNMWGDLSEMVNACPRCQGHGTVGNSGVGTVSDCDECGGTGEALAGPDTPADTQEDGWFIPEGDRQCGVVHKMARATCMKRRGHDGSHATPQGTWIDGPWCEYPADSQEEGRA